MQAFVFLFQIGSIKSAVCVCDEFDVECFYSKLVRLKEIVTEIHRDRSRSFYSKLVRLKESHIRNINN